MITENIFEKFWEVIDALEKEEVDYILIGGFAMVLYGMPRATQDLDIFIKNREENVEKLRTVLFQLFGDKSAFEITQLELNEYSVLRYGTDRGFYIDILSKFGDAFSYEDLNYEETVIDGHAIKIATVETLYKLKEKTLRAIDKTDLFFLEEILKSKNNDDSKI
ncbi:MAG TPA: nucleotidyl transferase AbiEii/AbiGii toxin family protein [Ignavibacteriaceae bacterium]|nr:nucleotidyl transferase AbiEii/AbiGii toxin family protein [Ignavibacteriaceae bacterium]